MAAFNWLGPARDSLREATLSFFRMLLATEEGRRAVVESLYGQPGKARWIPAGGVDGHLRDAVYPQLGRAVRDDDARRAPIFITARFRTGSTLLWNLFRHVSGCTSYYEPFNERRWFDSSSHGDRIDPTHLGASEYRREYQNLSHLARYYDERWINEHLFMDERFHAPRMQAYVKALIDAAPGRAVLQFNRVDFRLRWLRARFPTAVIIHLYRHPREQWISSLIEPSRIPREITVREFASHDRFYLLNWARDLSYDFPFLHPDNAEHPYELFYLLWRLSYVFGREHADAVVCVRGVRAGAGG